MKKNNQIQFLGSLIFLPVMTILMPLGGTAGLQSPGIAIDPTPAIVAIQKENIIAETEATKKAEDEAQALRENRAEAIDAYFKARKMPLEGTGRRMIEEAEKNEIDWRLLPAIAVRESTGGKHACKKAKFNSFGWASCKVSFNSNDHAIEIVAKNLGGNNPNTKRYYENKTTKGILNAYNPPHIIPRYTEQVLAIMSAIGEANPTLALNSLPRSDI